MDEACDRRGPRGIYHGLGPTHIDPVKLIAIGRTDCAGYMNDGVATIDKGRKRDTVGQYTFCPS